ncbi:hypothetical protein [Hyunsoonleella ulvae]|uniref:hypothetical protein n=1 Tax=Hyunsoonleella ulvae TaxID=2799948 RepID=UPI0019398B8B|nr:hypothetical protein [Hyunsoonleella ulvae]
MKKVALILGLLLVSFGAFAQKDKTITKRSDLKGPAYKNYKPWKYTTAVTPVYTVKKKALTGPAYKNYKRWTDTSKVEYVAIQVGNNKRQKLTGPAYKNYKPWRNRAK